MLRGNDSGQEAYHAMHKGSDDDGDDAWLSTYEKVKAGCRLVIEWGAQTPTTYKTTGILLPSPLLLFSHLLRPNLFLRARFRPPARLHLRPSHLLLPGVLLLLIPSLLHLSSHVLLPSLLLLPGRPPLSSLFLWPSLYLGHAFSYMLHLEPPMTPWTVRVRVAEVRKVQKHPILPIIPLGSCIG